MLYAALFSLTVPPLLNTLALRVCTKRPVSYCAAVSLAVSPLLSSFCLLNSLYKFDSDGIKRSVIAVAKTTSITLLNYNLVKGVLTNSGSDKMIYGAALVTSAICNFYFSRNLLNKCWANVVQSVAQASPVRPQREFEVAPVRHQQEGAVIHDESRNEVAQIVVNRALYFLLLLQLHAGRRVPSTVAEEYLVAALDVESRVVERKERKKEPAKENIPEYPPKLVGGAYTERIALKSQGSGALDIGRI